MGEIFYWVFNMSVAASISGCVVLILRRINKLPRRCVEVLWLIPFLRALLPFGLSGKYSLMSLISKFAAKTVVIYELHDVPVASYMNFSQSAKSYFPMEYKTNTLEKLFEVASFVWLCGFAALLLAFLSIYFTTMKELLGSEHLNQNIYLSDKVTSPAVYGIFRPKIIIPLSAKNSRLSYVLLHEQAHIRRKDNLKRYAAFLTVFVHWFNPLAWLFLKSFLADCELSCDESVLSRCGEKNKKEYATALLDFKENSAVFASAFGGARVRTRIGHILSYKRMSALSAFFFVILCVIIFYFLLTNSV